MQFHINPTGHAFIGTNNQMPLSPSGHQKMLLRPQIVPLAISHPDLTNTGHTPRHAIPHPAIQPAARPPTPSNLFPHTLSGCIIRDRRESGWERQATFRVGESFRISRTTLRAYGQTANMPTLCIRLVSGHFRQFTSAYLRRRKPPFAEVSGSNSNLPPPFTSASYLRLPPPCFSAICGSRRK